MNSKTSTPDSIAVRMRRFWQRWGSAMVIAVLAHACIGAAIVVLYHVTKPPPPRYVIADLLPPTGKPKPTASPSADSPETPGAY